MMQKDSLDWLALYKKNKQTEKIKTTVLSFDFCKKQQMEVKIGFFFFFVDLNNKACWCSR